MKCKFFRNNIPIFSGGRSASFSDTGQPNENSCLPGPVRYWGFSLFCFRRPHRVILLEKKKIRVILLPVIR